MRQQVEEGNHDKIVAIDLETGDFEVDASEITACDRLGKNGLVAFITNRSFIDGKTFDGFRRTVSQEFDHVYIVDLGGDIRSGDTTGNVFDIKTGVAIMFLVKVDK